MRCASRAIGGTPAALLDFHDFADFATNPNYPLDTFKSGNIALREPTKVSFFSSLNTVSKKITLTKIFKIFRRGQAPMTSHVPFASKSLDCGKLS